MAQGDVPPDKMREFSADIHREAQRLINLIEDILKLSKLDENASLPEKEPVELLGLCGDVLDSLATAAKRQEIRLSLKGETAEIRGIRQLLREMVCNLCDNAVKYNRPGGSVTVTVARMEEAVRLTVADTGIGIPAAEQGRVFERFYRVDKSHSRRIGGTGLGLSIVKHGALLHNARLSLQSSPDRGTTVTLDFPL
jgi:two-component system phosphate regulon sensor histidine kinase PhoR